MFLLLAAPNYGISWAILLLCGILGLMITLKPSGRKTEVKRRGMHYEKSEK